MAEFLTRTARILTVAGLTLLTTSCGESLPGWKILLGNYAYQQGSYQEAMLQYYRAARDRVETPEASSDAARLTYNLGNVYYSLGEGPAALEAWTSSEGSGDEELVFRSLFNRGVLSYQWGRYDEAYGSFRRALEMRPADRGAKINLELSLAKIGTPPAEPAEEAVVGESTEDEEEALRLLEYIRRKEALEWRTPESDIAESARDW